MFFNTYRNPLIIRISVKRRSRGVPPPLRSSLRRYDNRNISTAVKSRRIFIIILSNTCRQTHRTRCILSYREKTKPSRVFYYRSKSLFLIWAQTRWSCRRCGRPRRPLMKTSVYSDALRRQLLPLLTEPDDD